MADEEKSGGTITKVVAAVFGTIIAPLLVAVGIKHMETKEPAADDKGAVVKDKGKEDEKDKVLLSFNGKDLTGFYTFLEKNGKKDPKGVFTVKDGLLRVSGEEPGYLATEQTYNNYRLTVEYKWGEKAWPPVEDKARRSGIMVHADSADGAVGGILMVGYECCITEGKTGALKSWQANQRQLKLTAEVNPKFAKPGPASSPKHMMPKKMPRGKGPETPPVKSPPVRFVFMPGGPRTTVGSAAWIEPLFHDPNWKNEKGVRAKADVEKPFGEWNTLEIVCGPNIAVILNRTRVNLGAQPSVLGGKVLIRSEGAEIFFRKMELVAMKK